MPEEIFILIIVSMVLGVPILGFTARMVVRSIAEAFASRRQMAPDSLNQERMMRLEDEVDALRKVVSQLEEAEEFRKALDQGKETAASLPPGPPAE